MTNKILVNIRINYFLFRIFQLYFTFKKRKWEPNLIARSTLLIEKSYKTNLIKPSNYVSIKSAWSPNLMYSEPYTNDVFFNKFNDAFVSIDGIIFKGLKSFPGSYVYSAFYNKFDNFYLLYIYKNYSLSKIKDQSNFLLIFDHWSIANYFHWMCDSLPKLMFLRKLNTNYNFKIIIPRGSYQYVSDSIMKLGLTPYFFDNDKYIKVSNLYHLSYLSNSGLIHPVINELANVLKTQKTISKRRKYYLSRNHSITRSISNESELMNLLCKFDFEIIRTENKTLDEQIQLFSDCEVLISPHGAGLTNMLFMPKGSEIIEIGHAEIERQPLCYWHLANQLNHKYNFIPTFSDSNEIFTLNIFELNLIRDLMH
jgi:hypothetical protein